jgi:hypothetical protein
MSFAKQKSLHLELGWTPACREMNTGAPISRRAANAQGNDAKRPLTDPRNRFEKVSITVFIVSVK